MLSEQPEEGLRHWPERREETDEGENGGGRVAEEAKRNKRTGGPGGGLDMWGAEPLAIGVRGRATWVCLS